MYAKGESKDVNRITFYAYDMNKTTNRWMV